MNLIMIFILFFIFVFAVTSRGNLEPFSSDEAIQNIASLYNQKKLIVTDINVTGNQSVTGNQAITGNSIINGAVNSKSLITDGINLNGDLIIKADRKINSDGTLYLLPKNGVIIDKSTGGTGNLTIGGTLNAQGTISANNIGTDDMVYAGYSAQNKNCPQFNPGQAIGQSHTQLWNNKNGCYQVCPPGHYMVGIRNGNDWDWKHPLCKKFK